MHERNYKHRKLPNKHSLLEGVNLFFFIFFLSGPPFTGVPPSRERSASSFVEYIWDIRSLVAMDGDTLDAINFSSNNLEVT